MRERRVVKVVIINTRGGLAVLCDGVDFDNERNDHRFEILPVNDEVLIVTGTAG